MRAQTKIILVTSGIIAVIIAAILGSFYPAKPLTASLDIEVSPVSSIILINGKKVSHKLTKLKPGAYKVVFSHSGFTTIEVDITLIDKQSLYLGEILNPNTSATNNWFATHSEDQKLAESISGKRLATQADKQISNLELIKFLPFIDNTYRVDYGPSIAKPKDQAATALYITYYTNTGQSDALEWLKFKGYDPAKLEIIYKDAR